MTENQKKAGTEEPLDSAESTEIVSGCESKSNGDDPSCDERLQAIMDSPSYRPAIEDFDFLESEDTRPVRLLLDYLKPDTVMRKHGIRHTIVVFGSTRIVHPEIAEAAVLELREELKSQPDDKELRARLTVAQNILKKSHYYETAREFSRLVATAGSGPHDSRLVVKTGGGPGIMEAANRGASDMCAQTIGLNITLPHEQYPNPYVTPELCFQFHYFALRKMHFMLRARALVAFPGGFGTFDELFETLTLIQTGKIQPLPVVLVGQEYWRKAFDVDFMVAEGVIDIQDRDLFWYAETAEEIWRGINSWYERAGEPLIVST